MTIGLKYIGLKYYGLAIETLRSLHSKPELLGICRCIVESTSRGSEAKLERKQAFGNGPTVSPGYFLR